MLDKADTRSERPPYRDIFTESPRRGEHRTLAEKAFTSLHHAILTGAKKPGARLPIDEMAESLGMSAMPVREAVRRLGAMGLVENVPHKGARVTELSVDDLGEVYEARLVLEPLALYRAATAFTAEDEAEARWALDAMGANPSGSAEHWSAHSAFHLGLYRAGGSSWLMRLIQPLWESSERYRLASPPERGAATRRDEHEHMLDACAAHDAGRAAFGLYNHLASTANVTAKAMGGDVLFALLEGGEWVSPVRLPGPPAQHRDAARRGRGGARA
ncbi:MAG: GntR family transcriptional regulator [Actinomycetota bacterium]|nr:GntR family transcriptional regulator [Actinomycetota bacterium]